MSISKEQLENEIQQLSIPTGNSDLDEKRSFRKLLLENFDNFDRPEHDGLCPQCGNYGEIFPANNNEVCPICGSTTILFPFNLTSKNISMNMVNTPTIHIEHIILGKSLNLKDKNDLEYITGTSLESELFQRMLDKTQQKVIEDDQNKPSGLTPPTPEPKSIPKCPTCGSTKVKAISGTKRWLTVGLFGLASSNVGKTMECLSCKYKW